MGVSIGFARHEHDLFRIAMKARNSKSPDELRELLRHPECRVRKVALNNPNLPGYLKALGETARLDS